VAGNLTGTNARFCTWDGEVLGISINCERRGWRGVAGEQPCSDGPGGAG